MKTISIPITDLHQDPANARRHPNRNLSVIKAALVRFGQQSPLVIDGNNVIRKGNGTYLAAQALGLLKLDCVRTKLTGVEAAAYAIADNRSSELAEWDQVALAETLRAIQSEPDYPIEATGFTEADVEALLTGLGNQLVKAGGDQGEPVDDPAGEWGGMPECANEDKTSFRQLIIHFAESADVADFARRLDQVVTDKTKTLWHPKQAANPPGHYATELAPAEAPALELVE